MNNKRVGLWRGLTAVLAFVFVLSIFGGQVANNNAGGINGGLTNGNELVVRAAVKPTPSIGREQMTYNLATNKVEPLMIRGRHDVCVALRGAVVVEAAVAIALANFIR